MQQVLIAEGITALGKVREADGGDLVEVWTEGGRAHATPHTVTDGSQKSTSGWKTRNPCCRYLSGT